MRFLMPILFLLFHAVSWQVHAQCTFQSLGPDDAGPVSFARDDYPSLAIDATGLLYVAYADADNQFKVKVRKYDGSNWINLGLPNFSGYPGFSAGKAEYINLVIDENNVPYVTYKDAGNSKKLTVATGDDSSTAGGNRIPILLYDLT